MRPAHDGEAAELYGAAVNVATDVFYTVPAGYILLIFAWSITSRGNATAACKLYTRDVADATVISLWTHYYTEAAHLSDSLSCIVPWEVLAGHDLCLSNNVAGSYSYAHVHGILIPTGTV